MFFFEKYYEGSLKNAEKQNKKGGGDIFSFAFSFSRKKLYCVRRVLITTRFFPHTPEIIF